MLRGYAGLQRNLLEAAELMPEEHYSFKPTAETRPYGQLVAHVALNVFTNYFNTAAATDLDLPRVALAAVR